MAHKKANLKKRCLIRRMRHEEPRGSKWLKGNLSKISDLLDGRICIDPWDEKHDSINERELRKVRAKRQAARNDWLDGRLDDEPETTT